MNKSGYNIDHITLCIQALAISKIILHDNTPIQEISIAIYVPSITEVQNYL